MTKAELKSYIDIRDERDRLKEQVEELESVLFGAKSPTLDGMPRGDSGHKLHVIDRMGDIYDKRCNYYRAKVEELDSKLVEIEEAIAPLYPTERTLVRLHYFRGLTWEDCADKMGFCVRQIHRIHGRLIAKLQETETEKNATELYRQR